MEKEKINRDKISPGLNLEKAVFVWLCFVLNMYLFFLKVRISERNKGRYKERGLPLAGSPSIHCDQSWTYPK